MSNDSPLGIGIHYGVSPKRYHSDPCERPSLSASIANLLCDETPAHAHLAHPRLGGHTWEPTRAMDHGTLCHALLLGAGIEIEPLYFDDFKKKAAQEARDAAREAGKLPVLAKEYAEALESTRLVREKLSRVGVNLTGKSEVVLVWEESLADGRKVLCRAMMDHLILERGRIYDLKFTGQSLRKIGDKFTDFGYEVQEHAYHSGLAKLVPELVGRTSFEFLFCEADAPYCVRRIAGDGEMRDLGRRRWRRALSTWADCLERDSWPEYPAELTHVSPKPWAVMAEDDHGFIDNIP